MTNKQKYNTEEEREKAFVEFCKPVWCDCCNRSECKLFFPGKDGLLHCYDEWLALEAEEGVSDDNA